MKKLFSICLALFALNAIACVGPRCGAGSTALTGAVTGTAGQSNTGITSIATSFGQTPWTGNGVNGTASGLYGTPSITVNGLIASGTTQLNGGVNSILTSGGAAISFGMTANTALWYYLSNNSNNQRLYLGLESTAAATFAGSTAGAAFLGSGFVDATHILAAGAIAATIKTTSGAANKATCWRADGLTLGHCGSIVDATGGCTCN